MPGYFDDDTVLRICVEDIENAVDKRKLRGKDAYFWRKVSDAMWDMVCDNIDIAVDAAANAAQMRRRALRGQSSS